MISQLKQGLVEGGSFRLKEIRCLGRQARLLGLGDGGWSNVVGISMKLSVMMGEEEERSANGGSICTCSGREIRKSPGILISIT